MARVYKNPRSETFYRFGQLLDNENAERHNGGFFWGQIGNLAYNKETGSKYIARGRKQSSDKDAMRELVELSPKVLDMLEGLVADKVIKSFTFQENIDRRNGNQPSVNFEIICNSYPLEASEKIS